MEWNDVRFILAIADQGTLQAAAEQLQVNHTTVWRRVQALEKDIGTQLFIADRQGYRLTETGQDIIDHARQMAVNMDAIGRIASGKNKELKGLIRVTAPADFAENVLPRLIREFRERHPEIRFDILSHSAALDLDKREADIALRANSTIPDNLIGRKLAVSHWSLMISPELYQGPLLSLEEIRDYPLIGYRKFSNPAVHWLHSNFDEQTLIVNCSDVNSVLACVKARVGVGLIPSFGRTDLTEVYRLPEEYNSTLWLLTHKDLRSSARIKAFWDFLLAKNAQGAITGFLPGLIK